MSKPPEQLRADALRIWQAGVQAVGAEHLVTEALAVRGDQLIVAEQSFALDDIGRIAVVGAGKAGAGMAAGVEQTLGSNLMDRKQVTGWINVPADCVETLQRITVHAARPAGVNEPQPEGAEGARRILELVNSLEPADLCLCLISGGGSALLPAPAEGVSLDDKLAVIQALSAAGADIVEINTVRKQLSRIKGGGLARACRAGRLVSLIISDVPGDPLDTIASGPTVTDDRSTPAAALEVLERYDARRRGVGEGVFEFLAARRAAPPLPPPQIEVSNHIIGNNATAVDAAGMEAERLGYNHAMLSSREPEGLADEVGRHLAAMALRMRGDADRATDPPSTAASTDSAPGSSAAPTGSVTPAQAAAINCLITGGEPVVQLVDSSRRGLGGRNQQLALAALKHLAEHGGGRAVALLSGGTDGEDGPTDAAGAVVDETLMTAAEEQGLKPDDFLARNDAYHFFEPLDGLIKTGPTNTNVCDLRVVVVDRSRG